MGLLKESFGGNVKDDKPRQPTEHELNKLKECVGEIIEVHYFNQSIPRRKKSPLRFTPNRGFFYIGEQYSFQIIHFNRISEYARKDEKGKLKKILLRDAVWLIKDKEGNEVFRNDQILSEIKENFRGYEDKK